MEEKVRKILTIEFWLPIFVSLVIIVLFESETLLPGVFGDNKIADYYVAIVMELFTICLIPLALRLFKFKKVKASLKETSFKGLLHWGTIRLLLLVIPMMVNTIFYYLFMNVAFGYMGIIGLLCLVFVYPSRTRCNTEVGKVADADNA